MLEYIREIIIAIGGIGAFLVGRKSTDIINKKENANAVDAMQKTYDMFLKHYKEQYEGLLSRLDGLEFRNAILMESATTWESKFRELDKKYKDLQLICESLKKKI